MILKDINLNSTPYNYFDILGNDENALSKAFAYLLSKNKECFFTFLSMINVKVRKTLSSYQKYKIEIQKYRESGITDIEITDNNEIHLIIECKIKKGKVSNQRTQYNKEFNTNCRKILCLLTELYDSNIQKEDNVKVITISWYDIISEYNSKRFLDNELVINFVKFAVRSLRMNSIKEILIQGLSNDIEEKRYSDYNIYRRDLTFGSPLYFAPYYSKMKNHKDYGIKSLSKILGIITAKPSEIENFISEFEKFTNNNDLIEKWKAGIKLNDNDDANKLYTYYFLEKQIIFKNPLVKDGGIKKGRGKNWIAANIPKNRCVTFSEFLKHIPELMK